MKKRKRMIAAVLAAVMVFGGTLTAGAAGWEEADPSTTLSATSTEENAGDGFISEVYDSVDGLSDAEAGETEGEEADSSGLSDAEEDAEILTDADVGADGTDDGEILEIANPEADAQEEVPEEDAEEEEPEEEEDYGIATYATYKVTYNYETASFSSSSDGVSFSKILSKANSIINRNEGSYTSVLKSDNDKGLSIGKIGWHAGNALELLRLIISEDNSTAKSKLGTTLYKEITDSSTNWDDDIANGKYRILTDTEASKIEAFLGTDASKKIQDKLADSYITYYLNNAWSLGLRQAAALVYYADFENQYGYYYSAPNVGGAHATVVYAKNLVGGTASKITLNELHIASLCYVCHDFRTSDKIKPYLERRRYTYEVLATCGWTYCSSGDYVIPYDENGKVGAAWLKKALNTYMNAGLTVNSNYDSALVSAVKNYQKYAGLTQDGNAGLHTSTKLIYDMYYDAAANGGAVATAVVTDIVKINGKWVYTVNGEPDYTHTGVDKNKNGWWYVKDGVVDFTFNGFAKNSNGWWYIENGKVTFKKNGVIKDTGGQTKSPGSWWYVVGSKVKTKYTGVADYKNSHGWWYIKDGKVDFTANTVAKNKNGWWYVEGGKVIFSYNGFAENKNGKWYIDKGKVTFKKNGVIKDTTGKIGTKGTWYYVVGSKVQTGYTGVADYKNSHGWWYIKKGQVDFTADTVAKNKNGWWYVKDGKVRFSFNGIAENKKGWWYIKNGKVDFTYTGTVKSGGKTYSVTKGKVAR